MANEEASEYRQFLERLDREEHRPAALNELKNFLTYKPAGEAVNSIRTAGITRIIHCLNAPDKTYFELTCDVLKLCFEKFQIGDIVRNYTGHMMYLLRHEKSCVRKIAVEEVYKTVTTDFNLLPLPQYIDVFVAVAQLVSDEDIGVANKAILITSNLPTIAYPKVLDEMKIALEYSSSSKCNAYEVIVNISCKSSDLLELCGSLGYLDHMLMELQSNDLLFQLNIIELLSRLAVKPHGINYLVKHGALNHIAQLIVKLKSNPLGSILTPGYFKFFGAIAYHYPKEIIEKYPMLVDMLFETLENTDQSIIPVALDTLGVIGTTLEGKLCLMSIGVKYTVAINRVGELIKNSPTEIKIRAMHCLACLIGIENDPRTPKIGPVDHRITLMTREWFRSMSTKPEAIEILFGICKNPFSEIRIAAMILLDSICQHQWGQEQVARTAGFVEYLLDRTVDQTKETKEAKYDVIKRLAGSLSFDETVHSRLQTYVDQGPYFCETLLDVAIEEGD